MKRMSIDPTEYVVFDVETNGLKSKKDDLLSISFYKPDDGKEYSRFLPLELNKSVVTTHINGITEKDLIGASALTQEEFDVIVKNFELTKRTILVYSGRNFDSIFLREYMKRHEISGYEDLEFYNFKRNIISSEFSVGNISKDNLCKVFKIDGVNKVHESLNDCKLEWKLFEKMEGYNYLVTDGKEEDNIFRIKEGYIFPVGLFYSHNHLSRILPERPYIECESSCVKTFEIDAKGIEKFPTNITGMAIEHLINSMLNVDKVESREFLIENKRKLEYIGSIPNGINAIPVYFNKEGMIEVLNKEDKKLEKRVNTTLRNLKEPLEPLINFIKDEIFDNEHIWSQELVVDYDNNILAVCDLSSLNTILEIKTNNADSLTYKEQLFYEANGRKIYHLKMEWVKDNKSDIIRKIILKIFLVDAHVEIPESEKWMYGKREELKDIKIKEIKEYLSSTDIMLVSFENVSSPIKLQCKKCKYEWEMKYDKLKKKLPICPNCNPDFSTNKRRNLIKGDGKETRAQKYYEKVLQRSENNIVASNYVGAKEYMDATCKVCGYQWKIRADHLADRCWCPMCRKRNKTQGK